MTNETTADPSAVGTPVERPVRPMLFAPRDWQAMALRDAAELTGTAEGAYRLAESKRYGALADEIDRLNTVAADAERWAAECNRRDDLADKVERLRACVREVLRGDEGLTGSEYGAVLQRAERMAHEA